MSYLELIIWTINIILVISIIKSIIRIHKNKKFNDYVEKLYYEKLGLIDLYNKIHEYKDQYKII